jgi:hypothetical protein
MSPCNSVQPPSHLPCVPVALRLRGGSGRMLQKFGHLGVHGQSSNPNTMRRLTASGSVSVWRQWAGRRESRAVSPGNEVQTYEISTSITCIAPMT